MEQGWDPEVKRYFRKIISSFSYGLLWLVTAVTAGLYFGLAFRNDVPVLVNILFYIYLSASLFFLLRYYYRVWRK